jgi:hypothetical protein
MSIRAQMKVDVETAEVQAVPGKFTFVMWFQSYVKARDKLT